MIASVSSPIETPDSMLRCTKKDNKGRHCSQTSAHATHDRTDQGSQFTSAAFTGLLLDNAIAISMDGKAAWQETAFEP
jgi:hypothetical protein